MPATSKKTALDLWPDTLSFPEKIKWNGRSFNRVRVRGPYYGITSKVCGKITTLLLHRLVWEKYNNKNIPIGFVIHHIDGNALNNHPSNLQLINRNIHGKMHMVERFAKNPDWWKKGLAKARIKAPEWHVSLEGRKWHAKHGKLTWVDRKQIEKQCVCCGKNFKTYWPIKGKFCSSLCQGRIWFKLHPELIKKYNKTRNLKRHNLNIK